MTLAYAAGWIIVPGALLGLWLTLARPRTTEELAFGAVTVLLAAALFFEAGLLQASLDGRTRDPGALRLYAAPLLALSLRSLRGPGLAAARPASRARCGPRADVGAPAAERLRRPSTLNGSPILFGVYWLTGKLGTPGDASAVVAGSGPVDDGRRRARLETPTIRYARGPRSGPARNRRRLGRGRDLRRPEHGGGQEEPSCRWIPPGSTRAQLGDVTMLQSFSGGRGNTLQELFWNRSISAGRAPPGRRTTSTRSAPSASRVADDGSLTVDGRPLAGPLLADIYGSTVRLAGCADRRQEPDRRRCGCRTEPTARACGLYAIGRYSDGWLAKSGADLRVA